MRLRAAAALAVGLALTSGWAAAAPAATPAQPNIFVIEAGDMTVEALRVMQAGVAQLELQGTTFTNSFVSNPRCCTSRAALLTGLHSHSSGIWTNLADDGYARLDPSRTVAVALQHAGYDTAFLGDYLDGYGTAAPFPIPPGWNEWYAAVGLPPRDWNYALNENGAFVPYYEQPADYAADVFSNKAVELVSRLAEAEQPFLLWLSYRAAQGGGDPPQPPARWSGVFASEPLPVPALFNEADVADKPPFVRALRRLDAGAIGKLTAAYQRRLESLLAVDEGVAAILRALHATGELDNTLVVFTAADGVMEGQHRVTTGRVVPYEPAIRVPLILRGPDIPHDRLVDDLVTNGDVAPTPFAAAGLEPGEALDGTSLLPLAADPLVDLGRDVLLETNAFTGLRTPRYKYVRYVDGSEELYDLAVDPDELRNRRADPAYALVAAELKRRLTALRACAGATCRRGPRLELRLLVHGRPLRGCAGSDVRAVVSGADLRAVGQVNFYENATRLASDARSPFDTIVAPPAPVQSVTYIRARVLLSDGRRATLTRMLTSC